MKAILFVVILVLLECCNGLVVTQFPHYQTFDSWPECFQECTCYEQKCSNLLGGWTNLEFAYAKVSTTGSDEFNWWVKSGTTTSNTYIATGETLACNALRTGPCGDATSGNGNYLYAEISGCYGANFRVRSPYVNFTQATGTLSYNYYMFGYTIVPSNNGGLGGGYLNTATLTVSVTWDDGVSFTTLATHNTEVPGTANSAWPQKVIPLTIPNPPAQAWFLFKVAGAGSFDGYDSSRVWEADVAIDNVLITQAGASNVTIPYIDPPSNNTTPATPPPNGGLLNGGGGGLSDGAIAGIVVGIVAGLTCLCCLLLLLGILLLLFISPRKPGQKGGGGQAGL